MSKVEYLLSHTGKTMTVNRERSGNLWEHRKHTKEWRMIFALLAKQAKMPRLAWCDVIVKPRQRMGKLADCGAIMPSAKAAIDGIVDASVLPDDGPEFVRSLKFEAPVRGETGLDLLIIGVKADG